MPLIILTGTAGEFIVALPLTVSIALVVSFLVAISLTPLLCSFFIKKGLHDHEAPDKKQSFNLLDSLQNVYGKAIVFFMKRKVLGLAVGIGAIVLGGIAFLLVPQQFFPPAERNQFVIDVWMQQGTRIETTDAAMGRIEKVLSDRPEVAHYASFVGQSAPRFYYNVNPQQPDGAYGQFIVNTRSVKATPAFVADLQVNLAAVVPEAMVIVRELQQGSSQEAPIEIRISGDDIVALKQIATEVENMLRAEPSSRFVHRDYYNDTYRVDIDVNNELANRLGLTNGAVSQTLSGGFDGVPAGVFWEGDRAVTLLLRLDKDARSSFDSIGDAYVTSQLTHASVPLRAIANLTPEWQTSRIVRRNGVRTMTVRSFVKEGVYASALLDAVAPKIAALKLPPGYRIEYGGEKFNKDDNLPHMVGALGISLVAIFLVLLVQFRNISVPLVIMASIPLSLLGAAVGLLITRNPFGFMAFIGLISVCGIVVRNAIILVDYINEKIAEGHSLEEAATEAGQRRLRPIFLTTMAAAMGMIPMILSRSALWSPLASVIAVGLIFSMCFTLLVIPVLYVVVRSHRMKAPAAALMMALAFFLGSGQALAETRQLTLNDAVSLAVAQNSSLKIAGSKVREGSEKRNTVRSDYFPHLRNESNYFHLTNNQLINIPAGSLGTVPGLGPFPVQDTSINQGKDTALIANTTLTQPLTQLPKIHHADKIALADQQIAAAELEKTKTDVIFATHRLFYSLVVTRKLKDAASAAITAGEQALREARDSVAAGSQLEVAAIGSNAVLLQNRHALLSAEIQIADLNSELNDLLGLPLDTEIDPVDPPPPEPTANTRETYVQEALEKNPEIKAALESVNKAQSGVKAAQWEYVPDISAFGQYIHQDGVPFVENNIGVVGLRMTWDIVDWGKRRGVLGQRKEQLTQADENLRRVKKRIEVEVDKTYRKLEQTQRLIDVARESLELQKENLRLKSDGIKSGTVTESQYATAVASVKKAEYEHVQALLGYYLAIADLKRIVALYPGP
jgi:outer membrane protein TolC/preprotein translocase subunit SecF